MNPKLDLLQPYPFERLNALRAGITPNPEYAHTPLSIGEPKHAPPDFVIDALSDRAQLTADISQYPVAGSNVVTLMVFDHQLGVHQQLVDSHYKVRYEAWAVDEENDWEVKIPDEAMEVAEEELEEVVQMLLMVGEAPFPAGEVKPDVVYQEKFRENRREDASG